ncbi:MAG: family oxidoreductase [Dactylosporangium sp.]|nr:family oxidoreductase [Dactylosporangium sp.]
MRRRTCRGRIDGYIVSMPKRFDAVAAILASPAAHVTGASHVSAGGMLLMAPQAGSHLQSDDWRNG